MKILSRKKLYETKYLSEVIGRCPNKECQALLMIHEDDVLVKYYGYDEEDHEEKYCYFFECPVCNYINELHWLQCSGLSSVSCELLQRRCDKNLKIKWIGVKGYKRC